MTNDKIKIYCIKTLLNWNKKEVHIWTETWKSHHNSKFKKDEQKITLTCAI